MQKNNIRQIREWTDILKLNKEMDLEKGWLLLERKIRFKRSKWKFFLFIRNAAAVLLLPFVATTLYLYFYKDSKVEHSTVAQVETQCGYGQISKIMLSDGSEVWLNSGSKLRYPQNFTSNNRTVYLTGEAYFKVSANPKRRFDVKLADGLTTSAYGTEFNITAYQDQKNIEITLISGKIELTDPKMKQPQQLQPNECAVYARADKILNTIGNASVYAKTAWKNGKLVFRHTGMEEIVERLSRRYNVEIEVINPELFNREYSATFTTESIDDVIRLLSQIIPLNYKFYEPQRNEDLTFSKRKLVIQKKE